MGGAAYLFCFGFTARAQQLPGHKNDGHIPQAPGDSFKCHHSPLPSEPQASLCPQWDYADTTLLVCGSEKKKKRGKAHGIIRVGIDL